MHLTYQEYFAARYFVRQWQVGEPLTCPVFSNGGCRKIGTNNFLRKHKYTARYDVFWRFVAGLLDAEGKGEEFFNAIEEKPRDLLGPTHQRLVMHCLSEAPTEMPLRSSLETSLKEWLLFECKFTGQARLASEVEFPEQALFDALQEESDMKRTILKSLAKRQTLPSHLLNLILSWLEDGDIRSAALEVLGAQSSLSDKRLTAVVARLEDKNEGVSEAAVEVLRAQSSLSDELLTVLSLLLDSKSVGGLAEVVLRGYEEFYSTLLSGPSAGSLLKIFLSWSFEEQWSCYAEDGWCYVNAPDGVRNAGINDMKVFKNMVIESWPDGIPSVGEKI